jgi:hypothetical protein
VKQMIPPIMQNSIPLDQIIPHPRNFRQHPESQLKQLEASYERFGQFRSIVVQAQPTGPFLLVAGHGIVEAMRRKGAREARCDVLPSNMPEADVDAIMVADNLLPLQAVDDEVLLAQLLQEQQEAGYDLAALGSDEETLRQMLANLGEETIEPQDDEAHDHLPEDVPTRTKVGDIWQLDKHRVACMDALDTATYSALLQGIRPYAIIADPPYGMRLDTDFSGMKNKLQFAQEKGIKSGRKYSNVIGDHEDFHATLLAAMFPDVKEQFWFGADYYSATLSDTMHTGCWLVWDKRLDETADKMFGSCFELIWSREKHKRDILRHKWAGIFGTEHEPQRGRQHPNQKPVRLLEDIITRYTDEGQIILDPFIGSGTTLISAERTGRICYGCELSPAYCDVILARYEAETGQTAELLERVEVPT